ncbi:hypothetical protein CEXT_683971 [Caerostris extrusa]|uniref:Uncharacterized protein n=1 Tax=Caerostris extrusa TaxID=172846 RepID=A0AAV4VM32_CAEEX|nr:hypothetical protein CEXT_683971 [Caerostris extrusa]
MERNVLVVWPLHANEFPTTTAELHHRRSQILSMTSPLFPGECSVFLVCVFQFFSSTPPPLSSTPCHGHNRTLGFVGCGLFKRRSKP